MNVKQVGRFIRLRREAAGLTQKELANSLHVTDKAVSKWERGLSLPDPALLPPLAGVLGVTEGALLRGGEEPPADAASVMASAAASARRLLPPWRPMLRAVLAWAGMCCALGTARILWEMWYVVRMGERMAAHGPDLIIICLLAAYVPLSLWIGLRLCRRAQEERPFPRSGRGAAVTWLRYCLPGLALAGVLCFFYVGTGLSFRVVYPAIAELGLWEIPGGNWLPPLIPRNLPYFLLCNLLADSGPFWALVAYGAYGVRKCWYMSGR